MPWWEGRGGVGITCYLNIQQMPTRPARYKNSQQYNFFFIIMIMFKPNKKKFQSQRGFKNK